MKKFSRNKSTRLSVSKNWPVIKKKYINKNIYSMEDQLLVRIWDSFLFKLNLTNDQIIIKEYPSKLLLIVPTMPLKNLDAYSNYLRKLKWMVYSVSTVNKFPFLVHQKFINSPFLGAKLLNKFFNRQIKISTIKESIRRLKKDFINPSLSTSNWSLRYIFLIYNVVLNTINLSKFPQFLYKKQHNRSKKINLYYRLKNKIFFQKFFFKLNINSQSLALKLLLFLIWTQPSYHTINRFLLNLWWLTQISNKYNVGVQGFTLKFRGKLDKSPRKEKIKIYQGSLHKLNIKTNLKINYNNFFISNNGTSNVKFFLNY